MCELYIESVHDGDHNSGQNFHTPFLHNVTFDDIVYIPGV